MELKTFCFGFTANIDPLHCRHYSNKMVLLKKFHLAVDARTTDSSRALARGRTPREPCTAQLSSVICVMEVFWKLVKGELRQQLMSYAG